MGESKKPLKHGHRTGISTVGCHQLEDAGLKPDMKFFFLPNFPFGRFCAFSRD